MILAMHFLLCHHKCRCPYKLTQIHWCLGCPDALTFLCLCPTHQSAPCVNRCTWLYQSACPPLLPLLLSKTKGQVKFRVKSLWKQTHTMIEWWLTCRVKKKQCEWFHLLVYPWTTPGSTNSAPPVYECQTDLFISKQIFALIVWNLSNFLFFLIFCSGSLHIENQWQNASQLFQAYSLFSLLSMSCGAVFSTCTKKICLN